MGKKKNRRQESAEKLIVHTDTSTEQLNGSGSSLKSVSFDLSKNEVTKFKSNDAPDAVYESIKHRRSSVSSLSAESSCDEFQPLKSALKHRESLDGIQKQISSASLSDTEIGPQSPKLLKKKGNLSKIEQEIIDKMNSEKLSISEKRELLTRSVHLLQDSVYKQIKRSLVEQAVAESRLKQQQKELLVSVPKFQFYQTDETGTISVYLKNVSDAKLFYRNFNLILVAKINSQVLSMTFPMAFDISECSLQTLETRLEISLNKKIKIRWPDECMATNIQLQKLESFSFTEQEIDDLLLEMPVCADYSSDQHPPSLTSKLVPSIQPGLDVSLVKPLFVGLDNTGTICYMNSTVQCLLSIPKLTQFILNSDILDELNTDSPLASCKGDLVNALHSLFSDLKKSSKSFVPRQMLKLMHKYNTPFDDFEQHDAQEFLNWLLDNVHEEVNKVKKKPYVELPDFDEKTNDHQGAAAIWDLHLKRDNSLVVDLFHGQYKSRITCDKCHKTSVKYDPFMTLTVEIPDLLVPISVIVIFGDSLLLEKKRIHFMLPSKTTVAQTKRLVKEKLQISEKHSLIPCIVSGSAIQRPCQDEETMSSLADFTSNYCIYVLESNSCYLHVCHYEDFGDSDDEETFEKSAFGIPLVFSVKPEILTKEELYLKVLDKISNLLNAEYKSIGGKRLFELFKMGNGSFEDFESLKFEVGCYSSIAIVWKHQTMRDKYYNSELDEKLVDINSPSSGTKAVNLLDCLDLHCKEEEVEEWYCSNCKESTTGHKKMDLWKLPQVLVIHLKRFVMHPTIMSWAKRSIDVNYPIESLDLTNYCLGSNEKCVYELIASCNHVGTISSGHYFAYCKRNNEWFDFDDETVSSLGTGDVEKPHDAYLLFYQLKN